MSLFSDSDRAILEFIGLITPASPTTGFRNVHRRLLCDAPDRQYPNLPLASWDAVQTCYQTHFFRLIPDELISRATIHFLGFEADHAARIWAEWLRGPGRTRAWQTNQNAHGASFIRWVGKSVETFPTQAVDEQPTLWRERMTSWGLGQMAQDHILGQKRRLEMVKEALLARLQGTRNRHDGSPYTDEQRIAIREAIIKGHAVSCETFLGSFLEQRFGYLRDVSRLSVERAVGAHCSDRPEVAWWMFRNPFGDHRLYSREEVAARSGRVLGQGGE